jgi:hypothetical protein
LVKKEVAFGSFKAKKESSVDHYALMKWICLLGHKMIPQLAINNWYIACANSFYQINLIIARAAPTHTYKTKNKLNLLFIIMLAWQNIKNMFLKIIFIFKIFKG